MDRWILSRAAGLAEEAGARLADYDTLGRDAPHRDLHRRPLDVVSAPVAEAVLAERRRRPIGTPHSRRSTRRSSSVSRVLAPLLPFLAESFYGNLVAVV